jgi:hypothetical protein
MREIEAIEKLGKCAHDVKIGLAGRGAKADACRPYRAAPIARSSWINTMGAVIPDAAQRFIGAPLIRDRFTSIFTPVPLKTGKDAGSPSEDATK